MFSLIWVRRKEKKSHPDERVMVKKDLGFGSKSRWEGAGANLAKMRRLAISQSPGPSKRETAPVDTGCPPSCQPDCELQRKVALRLHLPQLKMLSTTDNQSQSPPPTA